MYYVNCYNGFLCKDTSGKWYFRADAREAFVFASFLEADESARSANLNRWAIFQPSYK